VKKSIIVCDNCKQEETNHEFVRVVRVEMYVPARDGLLTDVGLVDLGIENATFDLCGFCASRMRMGLKSAQDCLTGRHMGATHRRHPLDAQAGHGSVWLGRSHHGGHRRDAGPPRRPILAGIDHGGQPMIPADHFGPIIDVEAL
jgi:hypothetical protein